MCRHAHLCHKLKNSKTQKNVKIVQQADCPSLGSDVWTHRQMLHWTDEHVECKIRRMNMTFHFVPKHPEQIT